MRSVIICLVVVASIFISGTVLAQMCPMSKGKEKAGEECSKVISDYLGNKMVCPVMGTVFKADKDTKSYEYEGKIYYFCCPECLNKFKDTPAKYINEKIKSNLGEHKH